MTDFHCTLLWFRSIEILLGQPPAILLSELDLPCLFGGYRSPWKA